MNLLEKQECQKKIEQFPSFVGKPQPCRTFKYHQCYPKKIEYILEWNLLEKNIKRPFCCTVSILQVYFSYLCYITFWVLEYHFIENLKLLLKPNYEIGWFHN